jgi:hypothetical protein
MEGGLDFSGVTAVVSSAAIVAAITSMAVVKFTPRAARWGYNQVMAFFRG